MFVNRVLDILFPEKCGFCNIINEDYTCKKCKKKLEYMCINNAYVKEAKKEFDVLIIAYFYTDIVREKILQFKFKNKKFLYKPLSQKLIENILKYINEKDSIDIDCILSVPISIERYFERGYNQSYLIAKWVAKQINTPLIKLCLIKTKNNKKQSTLNISNRINNVKNVYKVFLKKRIKDKNILLIDDIYTTGATVNECSRILKENGAKKIIVATIAKA